ncbi:unnamed protein product [Vitrella brassicaformis CCMP3155]|uniref:RING-type domain-containing protein n=2 Tax=Vitrella brassicaformis TaxID=1169539 RepID=A0A0G4ESX8_VITBC|nr:unnamed protein product [Vitrella brassicaformis CCMP3155]|eukprot:CEM01758.1 unnamed protein product [Vitrella brassicaformis CCMP3155]
MTAAIPRSADPLVQDDALQLANEIRDRSPESWSQWMLGAHYSRKLQSNDMDQQLDALWAISVMLASSVDPASDAAGLVELFRPALFALMRDFRVDRSVQLEAATVLQQMAETGDQATDALAGAGALPSLIETLRRTKGLPEIDIRDIASRLAVVVDHLQWVEGAVLETSNVLPTVIQLLDHDHESIKMTAMSMLAFSGIWMHQSRHRHCPDVQLGVAEVLVKHEVVTKLSPSLLSTNPDLRRTAASTILIVLLTVLPGVCGSERKQEGGTVSLQEIVDTNVLPNAFNALKRAEVDGSLVYAEGLIDVSYSILIWATCSSLLSEGNEQQRRYAVDNLCPDQVCGLCPRRDAHDPVVLTMLTSLNEILRNDAVLGEEIADIIFSREGCHRTIESLTKSSGPRFAAAAKELMRALSNHATRLHPLPRDDGRPSSLSTSPPWVGGGMFLFVVALSGLWCFVAHPWLQRRQLRQDERQADQAAAELPRQRKQAKGNSDHQGQAQAANRQPGTHHTAANQPLSAAPVPARQQSKRKKPKEKGASRQDEVKGAPASAAADVDGSTSSTVTPSGSSDCLTPTSPADEVGASAGSHQQDQERQQREVATADGGGQWTQAGARHRKKKATGTGSSREDASSRQKAGQETPEASRQTVPAHQMPHPLKPPSSSAAMRKGGGNHARGGISSATLTADQAPRHTTPAVTNGTTTRRRAAGRGLGLPATIPPPPGAFPPNPLLSWTEEVVSSSTAQRPPTPTPTPPPPPPVPRQVSCDARQASSPVSSPPLVSSVCSETTPSAPHRRPRDGRSHAVQLERSAASRSSVAAGTVDCLICFGEHGPASVMYIPCRHMHTCTKCYADRKNAWQQSLPRIKAENARRAEENKERIKRDEEPLPLRPEGYQCEQCNTEVVFTGSVDAVARWATSPFMSQPT